MDLGDDTITTDVLVIGGGLGGCRAALRAREVVENVTVVDKATVGRNGASIYIHSQLSPWDLNPKEYEEWLQECVENTGYMADQDWLEVVLQEGGRRIEELAAMGVPYERQADGKLRYVEARGNRISKSVNADGMKMMECLRKEVKGRGIRLIEKVMITNLLTSDGLNPTKGRVVGAVGIDFKHNLFLTIHAKAVIVATGPMGSKMKICYVDHLTGDGHKMAYESGAALAGMELCSRTYFQNWERTFQAPGQAKLQGMGVKLINRLGERILERYDPKWMELTSLGTIVRAIAVENLEGRGPCYFDMRNFTEEDLKDLERVVPFFTGALKEFHLDPRTKPLETNAYVTLGSRHGTGIRIDLDCRTGVEGLFAVGFASNLPHNAAGSIASAPSTFANVSGYRAGERAAKFAKEAGTAPVQTAQSQALREEVLAPLHRISQVRGFDIFHGVSRIFGPARNSLFPNAARLAEVRQQLKELREEVLPQVSAPDTHELVKANEAVSFLRLSELAVKAMETRQESRGNLFREDYPFRDDENGLKWLLMKRTDADRETIDYWEVPLDRYRIHPPKREKVRSPFADVFRLS